MNDPAKDHTSYIAHIRAKDNRSQTVSEHLKAVQGGCETYGAKMGIPHLAGLAGWLHDLGKNTTTFKTYIQAAAAHPDRPPRRGSVDHSTAGGRLLYRRYHRHATNPASQLAAEWVGNCIISHHQGLRDYLDPDLASPFFQRVALKTDGMEEYDQAEAAFWTAWTPAELDDYFAQARQEVIQILDTIKREKLGPIASALLVKYLFSCLIDADRTNTQQFEEDHVESWTRTDHDVQDFFRRSRDRLRQTLQSYEQNPDASHPINQLRREMSRQCEEFASRPSGIYTLSIPTGGGKTLASLRYALQHALAEGKERIIYIVPYTTIIEQNAAEIRSILQDDDYILEHHSNVVDDLDQEDGSDDLVKKQLRSARDNWDRPIILTTMVQFLNTFYAKGTRNARRLHRLANAVLIFDEVQAMPIYSIALFNAALNFLHVLGHSTALLCTATQPALDLKLQHKLQLSQQAEIVHNLSEVSQQFKRVEIHDLSSSPFSTPELATFIGERMDEVRHILVILNTKTAVRQLFQQLKKESWVHDETVKLFHLSTNMCAAHRLDEIKEMKDALNTQERVVCVSTQLIEAGVNISFHCVIRSLAGLDSIAQAAGRCNRHGQDPTGTVYIIQATEENLTNLPEIRVGAEITQRVLREVAHESDRFEHDLLSPDVMTTYFEYYYARIAGKLNYPLPQINSSVFDLLNTADPYALYQAYQHKHGNNPPTLSRSAWATVEQYFQAIVSPTRAVLVPYNAEAEDILLELNGEAVPENLGDWLRKAQLFAVNLYDRDVHRLGNTGALYPLLHGHALALRHTAYSPQFGVEVADNQPWGPELT